MTKGKPLQISSLVCFNYFKTGWLISHYVSRSKWLFQVAFQQRRQEVCSVLRQKKSNTPQRNIINEQCKKERKIRMFLSLQVFLWITTVSDFFSHEKYGTIPLSASFSIWTAFLQDVSNYFIPHLQIGINFCFPIH